MTPEEALTSYQAGPETVVRMWLEMDARIHALERQVQDSDRRTSKEISLSQVGR